MVRLQHSISLRQNIRLVYFNSTMVRLQQSERRRSLCQLCQFQFHYGTITTERDLYISKVFLYFNSTMVRLQPAITQLPTTIDAISIPLWYDYNPQRYLPVWDSSQFQFHYGTITTLTRGAGVCNRTISIPLWYDYNLCVILKSWRTWNFNSTMVRLQRTKGQTLSIIS